MMEGLLAPELIARLKPESVSPGLLVLVGPDAPTRTILCAGGGSYEQAHVSLTRGVHVGDGPDAAEQLQARWAETASLDGAIIPEGSWAQGKSELEKAALNIG